MKRIIIIFGIYQLLLQSCYPFSKIVQPTQIINSQLVTTEITIPPPTPLPRKTDTPIPTKTSTSTASPFPKSTSTPTPTILPTPKGITELGYYLWDIANSTGLEIQPIKAKEFKRMHTWPFWLFSDQDWTYVAYFTGGFTVDEQANTFLVVSRVIKNKSWNDIGLGFSLFRGHIFSDCQGPSLVEKRINVLQCMIFQHDQEPFSGEIVYMYQETGLWYIPDRVYPLTQEQADILEKKYSIKEYPEEYTVYGKTGPAN